MEAVNLLNDRQRTALDLHDATRRVRTLHPRIRHTSTFVELDRFVTSQRNKTVSIVFAFGLASMQSFSGTIGCSLPASSAYHSS